MVVLKNSRLNASTHDRCPSEAPPYRVYAGTTTLPVPAHVACHNVCTAHRSREHAQKESAQATNRKPSANCRASSEVPSFSATYLFSLGLSARFDSCLGLRPTQRLLRIIVTKVSGNHEPNRNTKVNGSSPPVSQAQASSRREYRNVLDKASPTDAKRILL